jgi:hypothetical protein
MLKPCLNERRRGEEAGRQASNHSTESQRIIQEFIEIFKILNMF